MINVSNQIANISNTPGAITGVIANRPATAQTGTVFISTDTQEIYSYSGTAWTLVTTGGGPGTFTGWDDMLAQGQLQTTDREANINNNTFRINNLPLHTLLRIYGNSTNNVSDVVLGDVDNAGGIGNFVASTTIPSSNISRFYTQYNGVETGIINNYIGQEYSFGDFGITSKGTYLKINDGAQQIVTYWNDTINTYNDGIFLNFSNRSFYFGAIDSGNKTQIAVYDTPSAEQIRTSSGTSNADKGLLIDFANNAYYLGDYIPNNNGTCLKVDDNNQCIGFFNIYYGFGNPYNMFYVNPNLAVLGDFQNLNKGVQLRIDDGNDIILTRKQGYDNGIYIDCTNVDYRFGDFNYISGAGAGSIVISNANADIRLNCQSVSFSDNLSGNLTQGTSGSTSGLHLKVTINGVNYVIELKNP